MNLGTRVTRNATKRAETKDVVNEVMQVTTPDTLTLGAEQLPRVTPCAGRVIKWKGPHKDGSLLARVGRTKWQAILATRTVGTYWTVYASDDTSEGIAGTEPTAALAQRRVLLVLAALLAPLEDR